jgi:hypothetical protein
MYELTFSHGWLNITVKTTIILRFYSSRLKRTMYLCVRPSKKKAGIKYRSTEKYGKCRIDFILQVANFVETISCFITHSFAHCKHPKNLIPISMNQLPLLLLTF